LRLSSDEVCIKPLISGKEGCMLQKAVVRWRRVALWLALGCQVGLLLAVPQGVSLAASLGQIVETRGPLLQGSLPLRYNAHYLGLEPTVRDGLMTITLAYEPQNNPNLQGFVNFLVLTEDGLRRYLAGEDADNLDIASGSPLQFDPVGNKMAAAFQDSGRGSYTVIVYNNSDLPVTYALSVEGGVLVDNANQTLSAALANSEPTPTPTAAPTLAPGVADPATFLLPGSIRARRVTGALARTPERHYLSMEPDVRDGLVVLNFSFDPMDVRELLGNINFWILDEDGLRRVIAGNRPEDVNLATGFPVPFSPFPNELQASFNASGDRPYTVVIYNNSVVSATYALAANGGVLIDQYGQTNEAKVAAMEAAALSGATPVPVSGGAMPPAMTTPTATPTPQADLLLTSFTESAADAATATVTPTSALTLTTGVERLAGELDQPFEHHYLGLTPTIRDGLIVLTLDFDPKDSLALVDNLNFWVLDEDGLRRVVSGARPMDVGIASGSIVRFGADQGKLRAVINASGHGKYTIVVYNNSAVPATYQLRANGGLLVDETAQTTLP
jgi:hypothetical protein